MDKTADKSVIMHFSLCGHVQEIAYIQKREQSIHNFKWQSAFIFFRTKLFV
jgi:hypothetical protein